ncbi:MAG: type II toxin-antitoxin system VapC family toxin [bacterium]
MTFWDSSALVPVLNEESHSIEVRKWSALDTIVVAWHTRVEVFSALTRLQREGSISEACLDRHLAKLERMASEWIEIQPLEDVRRTAMRLLRTHVLRSLDALQLASAWFASEGRPDTMDFVCFDARLASAAQREGFRVRG